MSRVLVIGECGATHEGSKDKLLQLLETAHACGCDCFKPQWCSNPQQMLERRHIGQDHAQRGHYEKAYGWLKFPVEWHQEFRTRCHELGMLYACSVYLPQDVATLAPWVDYLKISSFEDDDSLRAACVGLKRTVGLIVSCGGGREWRRWDLAGRGVKFLHCVTAYPAPKEQLNLKRISQTRLRGFSDHSRDLRAGDRAVCAGAKIIETHYRLDDCDPQNPDYAVAFTPAEFTQYIQNIRDAETMLGTGEKKRQPCEDWAVPYRVIS